MTADLYGTRHLGVNYGLMFSAYGAGGLVGPYLAAVMMTTVAKIPAQTSEAGGKIVELSVGNYRPAFMASGIACVIAAIIIVVAVRPMRRG